MPTPAEAFVRQLLADAEQEYVATLAAFRAAPDVDRYAQLAAAHQARECAQALLELARMGAPIVTERRPARRRT
jgi:hypothetical protein